MAQVNISQENFVSGELSPNMRGRFDLPVYTSGVERGVNFIAEAPGSNRFRPGIIYGNNTRRNNPGCLIPFQFSNSQAYDLEFTENWIRFFLDKQPLTLPPLTITNATAANPIVITSAAHGLSNGDEVILSEIKGMLQLNNRSVIVSNVTANTFACYDNDGNSVDGTTYRAYTSNGIAEKIYEIASPYLLIDLFFLKYAQNADILRLVNHNYQIRDLTRLGATNWTLSLVDNTADPFVLKKSIVGVSQANPAQVTSLAHGYSTGDSVIIETVGGMTELNGRYYTITVVDVDNFTLDGVNSSAYGMYSLGGYASDKSLLPGCVTFYQGRVIYGYSDTFTQSFWGSRSLDSSGNPRYNDMTTGSNPDDGFKFTLGSATGLVDKIEDIIPTSKFLAIAAFSGVSKADGGSTGDPITPSNINVVPAVNEGSSQTVKPILLGTSVLYFHRTGLTLYSLEFDIFYDAFNAIDKNISSEHINQSGVIQMVLQKGRPQCLWMVRNDGILIGQTTVPKENINGPHRHLLGGTNVKVLSVGLSPRSFEYDQLSLIVEHTVNGVVRRYTGFMADVPDYPERDDYFMKGADQDADDVMWRLDMAEAQKQGIHLDCALTFDGSDLGVENNISITPGAVTGSAVTFTANGNIFDSTMVGRQIVKKAVSGAGIGIALISAYISATQVTCQILTDFDSLIIMMPGNWYLSAGVIYGLWHLEGQTVSVVTDGGEHPSRTVSGGFITLQYQTTVCQVGEGYLGFLRSLNLEGGGVNGPAQTKPKNVNLVGFRFLNTLGCKFGTSLYNLKEIQFRSPTDNTNRPPPLFSGDKRESYEDSSDIEKHLYVVQDKSLPCTVLMVVPYLDTDND